MKDYKKIIGQYKEVVKHQWGQSKEALFNQIVDLFNSSDQTKIAVLSYKKYGTKSLVKFFIKHGLDCVMVGKGPGGLRLIAVKKIGELSKLETKSIVSFKINNKEYSVDTGGAVFSRSGLDKGTRFLLETVLNQEADLALKKIADLGVGWGAIPIVLKTEFSNSKFVVYEKDESSLEAAKENLKNFKDIEYHQEDFTKEDLEKNDLDYIICNPPFHITKEEINMLFKNVRSILMKNGKIYFVVEKTYLKNFEETASKYLGFVNKFKQKDFTVFFYKKV